MNPLDWLTGWANSLANSLMNARTEIVKQLSQQYLPTVDQLTSKWYLFGLSGTYGLAQVLSVLIALCIIAYFLIAPNRDHSARFGRSWQSVATIALYSATFYPLYSLAYDGSQYLSQLIVNLGSGQINAPFAQALQATQDMILPQDVWLKVIVAFVAMLLTWLAAYVAVLNVVLVLVLGFVYIIIVALRPLGDAFDNLFHAANSLALTSVLTPSIMTFGLMLPAIAVHTGIPLLSNLANTSLGISFNVILGAAICLLAPIACVYLFYKTSTNVFGRITATVSGIVDINSMPPVSARDAEQSVKQSGMKAFGSTLATGAATAKLSKSDNLSGDLKSLAIEAAGAAAAATGHPMIAAAASATDTTLTKEKRKHAARVDEAARAVAAAHAANTPPPVAAPMAPPPVMMPPPQAPPPSPPPPLPPSSQPTPVRFPVAPPPAASQVTPVRPRND